MLFVFRGIRVLQVIMALVTLAAGVGSVLLINAALEGDRIVPMLAGVMLALVFLYGFLTTLRLPTSFVAVAEDRTRIRLGGFMDQVIDNSAVSSVALVRHPLWHGIGLRTNFRGTVTLASAPGTVAELQLKTPVRVWIIPGLLPVRARRLRVSIRNPQLLVARFSPGYRPSPAVAGAAKMPTPAKRRRR